MLCYILIKLYDNPVTTELSFPYHAYTLKNNLECVNIYTLNKYIYVKVMNIIHIIFLFNNTFL